MNNIQLAYVLLIIVYILDILPRMETYIEKVFNNILIRFALIVIIVSLSKYDYLLGLLASIAFIQTHVHIKKLNQTEIRESFGNNELFPIEGDGS